MSHTQTDAIPDDTGNGSGAGPEAAPPSRSYTHADPPCIRQILSMDKDDKRLENAAIEIRNKQHDKRRKAIMPFSHATLSDISADESFITVSTDRNKRSPGAAIVSGLKKLLSPILRASKRSGDDTEESRADQIKRLCREFDQEIDMAVGEVFSLDYSDEILELEAEREYIPLTLFTVKGHDILHDRLHDVRQKTINAHRKGEVKKMLVDTNHALFGKEEDLTER